MSAFDIAAPTYAPDPNLLPERVLEGDVEMRLLEEIEAAMDPFEETGGEIVQTSHGRIVMPLDEGQVKGIVQLEIEDSLGGLSSEIAEQRRKAIQYYRGDPFGNELEGRSRVVLHDVADTVEWILPALMRMFTGGHQIVRFEPVGPDDEEGAKQATDYVNHIFIHKLKGFQILHDWFKTALIEKNALVKTYTERRFEPKKETYEGLDEDELLMLMQEPGLEIIEQREYTRPLQQPDGSYIEETAFDVVAQVAREETHLKVVGIPPEEFLIARRATVFDDYTPFSAHRVKRTASDLIAMGFDKDLVYNLPSDDTPEYSVGRTERLSEDETFPVTTAERADPASREIWTIEAYIRIDEDGDGYAELRKILAVGESSITILEDEEINRNPISSICPVPFPYKFFGNSVADQVMDLQLIRSQLLRNMLDNQYLINNSRTEVVEGEVEIDDLLTSRPGGIVRVRQPGMVNVLETKPLGPGAMGLLEYLETVRENRTGITRYNQGLDASSLNQTATGINAIMNAAQARVELIARIFAETGIRDLFQKILREVIEHDHKPKVLRMRGKWVQIDPSIWNADMDVQVQVGLGVGQANERVTHLQQVLQTQAEIKQAGLGGVLVNEQNVYNVLEKWTEAMGFRVPGQFWTDPTSIKPEDRPEEPPDPKLVEIEQKGQVEMAKLELEREKMQLEQAKMEQEDRHHEAELRSKEKIELARIESMEVIGLANCEAHEHSKAAGNGQPEAHA